MLLHILRHREICFFQIHLALDQSLPLLVKIFFDVLFLGYRFTVFRFGFLQKDFRAARLHIVGYALLEFFISLYLVAGQLVLRAERFIQLAQDEIHARAVCFLDFAICIHQKIKFF